MEISRVCYSTRYYYCYSSNTWYMVSSMSASEGTHTRHTSPLLRDFFLSLRSVYFSVFFAR